MINTMTADLEVVPKSILEILGDTTVTGMDLHIPEYQRSYSWTSDVALQLFDDLNTAIGPAGSHSSKTWAGVLADLDADSDPRPTYVIGSLILHAERDKPGVRNVVDGQQRTLTLLMMKQILLHSSYPMPDISNDVSKESPASAVRRALFNRLNRINIADRQACWQVIARRAQMVVITTQDLDEAFNIFDAQNTRGRGLDPHDLLKAFHLREMRNSSAAERAAAIERWEETDQDDLRRLFARYLYRIARWARGESGRHFTEHDIEIFKGISSQGLHTPVQQYHAAAQTMIPAIYQWESTNNRPDDMRRERLLGHTRFRLDEPGITGGVFFEMVDFFLQELRRLRKDAVPAAWDEIFGTGTDDNFLTVVPGRSTMLYVSELYLAVMLYTVNRFGEHAVEAAGSLLRRWAFQPRVEMYAVREERIDNMGKDQDSVFRVMRNSHQIDKLLRYPVDLPVETASKNGEAPLKLMLEEAGMTQTPETSTQEFST